MNQMKDKKTEKGSRAIATRLASVQAVYQMNNRGQDARSVIEEYLAHRLKQDDNDDAIMNPDGKLFSLVVSGVEERRTDLDGLISASLQTRSERTNETEPLLYALLLCGVYELLARLDVDAGLIINDYIDITHDFYDLNEPKLVNAVLDSVGKTVRE